MKPLAIAAALMLAACAGPREEWTKEGVAASELERDSQACQRSARIAAEREAFRSVPAAPPQVRVERGAVGAPEIVRGDRPGGSLDEAALRNRYFNTCMQDLGYRLQPVPRG